MVIKFGSEKYADKIVLVDLQGKVRKQWNTEDSTDQKEISLNLAYVERGLYLLKTEVNGQAVFTKV